MPVRKTFGWTRYDDKGKVVEHGPTSPIRRKKFIGDPAVGAVDTEPEATTARGKRKHRDHPEHQTYLDNREARSKQQSPADHSMPVHKGPRSRPKGMDQKSFRDRMAKREVFEF